MTTDTGGSARPGRVIGLSLLAVAAAATVLGVVTLLDGDGDGDSQAGQPPSATAPPTAPPSGDLTSSPAPAITTVPTSSSAVQPPAATTTPPAPTSAAPPVSPPASSAPTPGPGTGPGAGPGPTTPTQSLRVYNNSTITGLANRAKDDLQKAGWNIAEVGNYSGGKIPTTTVYFQPGTDQEPAARELAQELGIRSEARFDGIREASPGLILIVTNDYKSGNTNNK
ncbi:LytR C-terminal domain-containing protein [Actinokineospora sp. NBRC 105648]|uniref:LytR C-terminal domain-containing protein n=1 Tax=Actinokineospora sp. NBRC 105648 TaxID=3032206 RepID=UPI0024A03A3C|nr:LytR C-terminal domain-containing protein [Actinokineospora sp. NBRC 105648]GLZ41545.1 hypothetical protein Acsp05_51690 [Actinokineospora sp. NBRC 105648]